MHNTLHRVIDHVNSAWEAAPLRNLTQQNLVHDDVVCTFQALHTKDQAYRALYVSHMQTNAHDDLAALHPIILQADRENRTWLRTWITQYGWPLRAAYGELPAETAWLVALHSDIETAFQKDVLNLIHPLFKNKQLPAIEFAALSDRIDLAEGNPQYWGMFYFLENDQKVPTPPKIPRHSTNAAPHLA